ASAGRPGPCSNVPVSVSFVATDIAPAAAITNDDPTRAYKDGVDGLSAIIFFNLDCNGTRDMVIDLSGSTRTLNVNIPSPIPGSLIQTGPVTPGVLTTKARINVRNILAYPTSPAPALFYTTMAVNPFSGPAKGSPTYRLYFTPDSGTCPAGSICATPHVDPVALANSPVETAWVKVNYTPRDVTQPWSPTNTDSWVVDGELTTNEPGPDYPIQRG